MFGRERSLYLRLRNRINNRPAPEQAPTPPVPSDVSMVARQRIPVAVEKVSRVAVPGGKNVKKAQAWKYPNFSIVRAPTVEINGRVYTDPKSAEHMPADAQAQPVGTQSVVGDPRRKQESNFFITINPNKKFEGDRHGEARARFGTAIEWLSQQEVLARCLKFGPKDEYYARDNAYDVILPDTQFSSAIEVGEEMHRMHCHIWVTIEHYSQIQINVPIMQYEFKQKFNEGLNAFDEMRIHHPPYLQVKLLPQSDWTSVMRQYIRKGMQ